MQKCRSMLDFDDLVSCCTFFSCIKDFLLRLKFKFKTVADSAAGRLATAPGRTFSLSFRKVKCSFSLPWNTKCLQVQTQTEALCAVQCTVCTVNWYTCPHRRKHVRSMVNRFIAWEGSSVYLLIASSQLGASNGAKEHSNEVLFVCIKWIPFSAAHSLGKVASFYLPSSIELIGLLYVCSICAIVKLHGTSVIAEKYAHRSFVTCGKWEERKTAKINPVQYKCL